MSIAGVANRALDRLAARRMAPTSMADTARAAAETFRQVASGPVGVTPPVPWEQTAEGRAYYVTLENAAARNEIGYAEIPRLMAERAAGGGGPRPVIPTTTVVGPTNLSTLTNGAPNVSLLGGIVSGIFGAGKQGFTSGATAAAGAWGTRAAGALAPRTGAGGVILPAIGSAAGSAAGDILKRMMPGGGTSGCNCGNGRNGRDPCTGQKTSGQRAPEATFFGGCCPPGRRLIRRPWARDICGKVPRMNPFNPNALARADRRLTSFARRSTAMLRDMGFAVSTRRHVKVGKKKRRR